MSVSSIGQYIREQREQAKISLRQLASAAGVSNPYLSQIERGLRKPSAEILQQIAKGLRISAEALYVQAGILEDRRPDSGVRAALLADPELSERQKQVLLEIYESFRREAAAESAAEEDESGPEGLAGQLWSASAGAAAARDLTDKELLAQAEFLRDEEPSADEDPLAGTELPGTGNGAPGVAGPGHKSEGLPDTADRER
jgi:transcriptional regulator with XRE-family HTH domain